MSVNLEERKNIDRKSRMQKEPVKQGYRASEERIQDFNECDIPMTAEEIMTEAGRCIQCARQPCVAACPLENDIPLAMWYAEHGDFMKAADVYRQNSPLPEICGRVCPSEDGSCVSACVLNKQGKGINTRAIETFVTEYQRQHEGVPLPEKAPATGKRVAVIGAGPAGLTAAEHLTIAGHSVTIYEALPDAGGLLVYGIPAFKLEKDLVDWKVDWLKQLGVDFVFNTRIGADLHLDQLLEEHGFDAVFLGTGAGIEASMSIPGEDLEGVYGSIEYLIRGGNVPLNMLPEDKQEPIQIGKRVGIIGGGDTATDCMRTALRQGAEEVVCYYRRTEAEMPGNVQERDHAIEEGARIDYLTAPVELLDKSGDGKVDNMIMIKMELGEPDDSGRRRPVKIEGSEYEVAVDNVILSIGFWPDPMIGEATPDLETHKYGLFVIDEETGATSRAGVYAGGDSVTGPALVNAALAAGAKAAKALDAYLASQ